MSLCATSRAALAGRASWQDAVVIADAGATRALASLGGTAWVVQELGAATVASLEAGAQGADALAAWHRAQAASRSHGVVRVIFLVTSSVEEVREELVSYLRAEFAAQEVEARVLSGLSAKAQSSKHAQHRQREGVDFPTLGNGLAQAARPKIVHVTVVHAPWAMEVLVDANTQDVEACPWAAFALASEAAQSVFPVTLSRHGLSGKRASLDEVDGNTDLSEDFKTSLRATARELVDTLATTLRLDFSKDCWAAGFTSRVLGNAMLNYLKEDKAGGLELPGSGQRKSAKLILIDRTLDISISLAQSLAPLVQDRIGDDMEKERAAVEAILGPLSTRQAWDPAGNQALRELVASDPDEAGRALASFAGGGAEGTPTSAKLAARGVDPGKLAEDHVLASAALAYEARSRPERRGVLATERILLESQGSATHMLLPLVDICNRKSYSRSEIERLALLAHGLLSRKEPSLDERDAEAIFAEAVESAGLSKHAIRALQEVRSVTTCRDLGMRETLAVGILERALNKSLAPVCLSRLGESALEKTAKEFETHARNFFKQSFSAFGIGRSRLAGETGAGAAQSGGGGGGGVGDHNSSHGLSPTQQQHKQHKQQRLELSPGETCVFLFVGGVCHQDMRAIAEFLQQSRLESRPGLVLVGGTRLTSAERIVKDSFRVVQVPSFVA
ncbi:Hypothetical Protein FCC1311_068312 [Hondaea fermentalgiana]|uniref:Uncharacterized protein n=1 Tax=Hondaea fermentalgiana TaxID=2315210 RepID=A0A2R5GQH7_9STRA|nr:Hypothetical Protein FCC1311_068312 [Hondaea fermentalgiana]|eukprot:GBG30611.1 Hypothetical Protein FCC1311_068312 [Hondaea fermentalgiana]